MLSLRQKLVLSYAVLILITIVVGTFSISRFRHLGGVVGTVLQNNYRSIQAADKMKESLELENAAALLEITGDNEHAVQEFSNGADTFAAMFEVASHNITEPGEDKIVADIGEQYKRYNAELQPLIAGHRSTNLQQTYHS